LKINVVAVKSGWILTKIAERIVANAPDGVEMVIGKAQRNRNNFYVDITNCFFGHLGGRDIGLFTHVHANDPKEIRRHWWMLDHIIHMSRRSRSLFEHEQQRIPFNSLTTHSCRMPGEVPPGFEYKKPTIGIFQRGQYEGKGFNMMRRFAENPVAADFNWVFAGNGWEQVAQALHKKTTVINHGDSEIIWPEEYKELYSLVDYVLVPSKWEGGPMGLLEAAALGKQIIAARVGWVDSEMPVDYSFKGGNDQELGAILAKIVKTRKKARKVVENLSYANYAEHVVRCFERIK